IYVIMDTFIIRFVEVWMEIYTVDAFTDVPLGGNPAGVAIFARDLPGEEAMRAAAAEMGYSETAFILKLADGAFRIRFFTPVEEVPLCGHATVGAFSLLLKKGIVAEGKSYIARTGAGDIEVSVQDDIVWLDMAKPRELFALGGEDTRALLSMFSLPEDACGALAPAAVDAGLPDIMLPLKNRELLSSLAPDFEAVARLSERLGVTGVHVYAPGESAAGYCRNFAPLYGIPEEAATGTSNGALTYYLFQRGMIKPGETNLFIQGEAMGKPSEIYTRLALDTQGLPKIRVGGRAVVREGTS
ncbi:MAG TPA: PhzF family phenazine biosynthesis protein, partial [Clostridia bacterium]|nr:PhzF family phenazine biosynthesis protein [Clostridia bacterium]